MNCSFVEDGAVQRDRGLHALDDELLERAAAARDGLRAVLPAHDQLRDQRVVVRRDDVVAIAVRVDAHARAARQVELADLARVRREGDRVLGVDAALDGVAAQAEVALRHRELLARRDADLLLHQVDAGHLSVTGCSTWMRVFISMK